MDNGNKKHSVSRRELLLTTGAVAIGSLVPPLVPVARAGGGEKRVPGLQLYTLRDSMAEDLPGTLKAVAAMGYGAVEFAGYGDLPPAEIRGMLDGLGLAAPSGHMDGRSLRADPSPLLDTAAAVGHEYVTVPWLAPEDRQTLDDYRGWADALNRVGEACRSRGLRVAYHNHEFELTALEGALPYDILLEHTDPALVDLQLDFFWARKAGVDIVDILARAPERFTMAHIKDMTADGDMTDVGSGVIDFAAIFRHPAARHLRHLFVEHDEPAVPFRTAAIGRYALSDILAAS